MRFFASLREIVLFSAVSDARVTLLPEPRITRYHTGKVRRPKGRPRGTIAFMRAAHTPPLRLSVVSCEKMRLFSPAVPRGGGAKKQWRVTSDE